MIANIVTFSRFVIGLTMIYFAFNNSYFWFFVMYFFALITDIADGYIARKLNLKTKFGAKLDIMADNFIVLCLLISLFIFKKQILIKYGLLFLFVFSYFLLIQLASYFNRKKLIFMRTYIANLAAIVFPLIILSLIIFEIKFLIYFYFILMIYALTEKLFLTLVRKKKLSIFFLKEKKIIIWFFSVVLIVVLLFLKVPLIKNQVCFENTCINIQTMDNLISRSIGLMYRNSLEGGLFFVFDETDHYSFWMKNVKFPIDIIHIDENMTITQIFENVQPCIKEPCELYTSYSKYVVEANAGFSEENNLKVGQKVRTTI